MGELATSWEHSEHAPLWVLRERVQVAMTLPHNHPGIAGVPEGRGCPRCNAEHALRAALGRVRSV